MDAAADRPEFAPPPQPGLLRAFVLAVIAHLLLILALTHGLHWKREVQDAAVKAELWSALPQEAAPKPVPAPPPPVPAPPPPPPPVVKAAPVPEPPAKSEADIALERAKEKKLEQQKREAELEKQRAKEEAEKKREEELARRKLEQQKKREEELAQRKLEQQKQLAEAKKKEEEKKRKREEQEAREAKLREQIRQDTMKRMAQAAGTGSPDATGTAAHSSGPSSSWAGRVVGKVRPNIVFTGQRVSTWKTEVEIRLAPDGTIVSHKIKSSNAPPAWDEAVLRALDRTQVLPRDVDGRVPPSGTIVFRPD